MTLFVHPSDLGQPELANVRHVLGDGLFYIGQSDYRTHAGELRLLSAIANETFDDAYIYITSDFNGARLVRSLHEAGRKVTAVFCGCNNEDTNQLIDEGIDHRLSDCGGEKAFKKLIAPYLTKK